MTGHSKPADYRILVMATVIGICLWAAQSSTLAKAVGVSAVTKMSDRQASSPDSGDIGGCIEFYLSSPGGKRQVCNAIPGETDYGCTDPGYNIGGQWSPDRSRVAFSGITVMNADGTNRVKLAQGGSPIWSPDGRKLAYEGYTTKDSGNSRDVYVQNVDGTGVIRVTYSDLNGGRRNRPGARWGDYSWAPDSKAFAFGCEAVLHPPNGPLRDAICVATLTDDSASVVGFTAGDPKDNARLVYNELPAWSPQGDKIVFSARPVAFHDLFAASPNGRNLQQLTDTPTIWESWPSWSPDGSLIAYVGGDGVYVMRADGSNQTLLASLPGYKQTQGWTPDGAKIVFSSGTESEPDKPNEMYSVNVDGSGLSRLFGGIPNATFVRWIPVPCQIMPSGLAAPVITYPTNKDGWATIGFNGDVGGTSAPKATIHLYRKLAEKSYPVDKPNGEEIAATTADSAGNWLWRGIELLPGDNIFAATAELDGQTSSVSSTVAVMMPRAQSYGGKYEYDLGTWEFVGDPLTFSYETINTSEEAQRVAGLLKGEGYDSRSLINSAIYDVQQELTKDSVFYYSGHGKNNSINIQKSLRENWALDANTVRQLDLWDMRLVVLNACSTGKNVKASDNILRAFQDAGAQAALGFKHDVDVDIARAWAISFWNYALNDEFSVADAAYQAARDVSGLGQWWWPGDWRIDEDTIVVVGDGSLNVALSR